MINIVGKNKHVDLALQRASINTISSTAVVIIELCWNTQVFFFAQNCQYFKHYFVLTCADACIGVLLEGIFLLWILIYHFSSEVLGYSHISCFALFLVCNLSSFFCVCQVSWLVRRSPLLQWHCETGRNTAPYCYLPAHHWVNCMTEEPVFSFLSLSLLYRQQ